MNRRNIAYLIAFVIVLGCFFQFSRMDGFLRLNPAVNSVFDDDVTASSDTSITRDTYLILYDANDVASVLSKHNLAALLEKQKKAVNIEVYNEAIPNANDLANYRGVFIISGDLDNIVSWDELTSYAQNGGTVAVLQHVDSGATSPAKLQQLGITAVNGDAHVQGLHFVSDFLLGGDGFSIADGSSYNTGTTKVTLSATPTVHITSDDGTPLLWTLPYGAGEFIVYNGDERDDKSNNGIYVAIANHMGAEAIYPVLASKVMFIDDFPAPTPEGDFPKIYAETGLSTGDFFRKRWWPFMQNLAKQYDLKYTGLIIESYGDQIQGPFNELAGRSARDNVIVYGHELLNMGGELGIHGYNHQSLVLASQTAGVLDYTPWPSENEMVAAISELRRYITELYPHYDFRVYVPPSNIISDEGRAAVKQAFPSIKIFASLYQGPDEQFVYYQDFAREADGTYDIPRVSAGYIPSDKSKWEVISAINTYGIFSHFVHPDEIFYEESKDYSWAQMATSIQSYLAKISTDYPWLTGQTASECMKSLQNYLDMDYQVQRTDRDMKIYCSNFTAPVHFVLRTDKVAAKTVGCELKPIGKAVYLVTMTADDAQITWKETDE